jgi:ribosomal protein S18 acetylase RimI-like enzyme
MPQEELDNYQLFVSYSGLITNQFPNKFPITKHENFNGLSILGSGLSRISTFDYFVNEHSQPNNQISKFIDYAISINEKLIWFNFFSTRSGSHESILALNFFHAKQLFWTSMYKRLEQQKTTESKGKLSIVDTSESDNFAKWMNVVSSGFNHDPNKSKLTSEVLGKLSTTDNSFLYLYKIGDRAVSACQIHIVGNLASLYWVATAKEEQGKGFARQMVSEIEQRLIEKGISTIHLQSTPAGIKTYKSLGFVEIGKVDLYLSRN